MARNVISDTQFRGASASQHGLLPHTSPADTSSTNTLKQGLLPLALSISDNGSEALIEMPAPVHEPEVTKKRRTVNRARVKSKTTKTAKLKKTSKPKSKKPISKPAGAAKKAASKSPVKPAPPSKLAAYANGSESSIDVPSTLAPPVPLVKHFEVAEIENTQCSCPMEIERLGAPNDLGISAIASAAQDATPPWRIEPAAETEQDLTPLPRSAALQIYGKNNWLGSATHWMRSNVLTLFVRRQKRLQ
jgi:hypothetical protein